MVGEYTDEELRQLHEVLYEILGEIKRVCEKLDIHYLINGGTAIGAFYFDGIIPWDDDIDIAMKREDYERFIKEAQKELDTKFFLQNIYTEPHTLYYYCKLMKRGTLFQEKDLLNVPVQQGIYVDIFPLDRVPNNKVVQKIQRTVANFFNCAFMAKEQWRWKHFGKCEIDNPSNRGIIPCLLTRITMFMLSKRTIYKILHSLLSLYNSSQTEYYNLVLYPRDHMAAKDVENPQQVKFGQLTVTAPNNLETYLRHHYPWLTKYPPKDKQVNHHPYELRFDV